MFAKAVEKLQMDLNGNIKTNSFSILYSHMCKIFLVGDIHCGLGYPNRYSIFFKVHEEYFSKFLFPLLDRECSKDDIIVLLGDIFDNRNVIPIDMLNYVQNLLERLSTYCKVHVLIGNHDCFHRDASEVNTPRLYKYIPNITIYENPTKIEFCGKSILMMPWVDKKKDQIEILKKFSGCDYLFCHSDLNGAKMHLTSVAHKNLDKIDVEEFSGYKNVYSGHIHLSQKFNNFSFVGSIFEMDRNDMNNQKGITILDTNGSEKFIENNVSPKFKKVYILKEEDIEKLEGVSTKDWIDLFISNSILIGNRKLRRKLEIMLEKGDFASVEYVDDLKEEVDVEKEGEEKSVAEKLVSLNLEYDSIIREFITDQKWDNEKIRNGVLTEFNEIIKIYKDTNGGQNV